ncbi:hypothetical protein HZH68_016014 [Vespula germanica]|uniref:Uncharacterized protein n=1 Tax=Vespula germanica TaxID=30212 RepID=A0A834MRM3_VESGE|nr:hypothetical protein HZH68_016014 [Vespula germanica]
MNSEHRKRIDLYCDIIVPKLNIMKLWPKLLENGIFNIDDINISTWKRNFDKEETVKSIWLTIKTRGPFAFQNLLLSLQQSDHEELAEMILQNLYKSKMRSNPRGLVLIITNIDYNPNIQKPRKSAIHDEINLQKLFEEMGFSVETYSNLTGQQIMDRVKTFSQRKDLQNVDSCFVIISSHGKKGEENYTEIEAEKPKVFIFQLCRGDKRQTITHIPEQVTDSSDNHTVMNNPRYILREKPTRNYSDFLIAYATLPGYVAFRNNITGSWFIQIFCEVFMNYAHDHHLCDLLKLVDSRLKNVTHSGGCQTVVVETKGFHKYCFLNPGFFGNEKKQ